MPITFTRTPSPTSSRKRRRTFHDRVKPPFRREKNMDTPITKRKQGKTKSVGVKPFHCACRSIG